MQNGSGCSDKIDFKQSRLQTETDVHHNNDVALVKVMHAPTILLNDFQFCDHGLVQRLGRAQDPRFGRKQFGLEAPSQHLTNKVDDQKLAWTHPTLEITEQVVVWTTGLYDDLDPPGVGPRHLSRELPLAARACRQALQPNRVQLLLLQAAVLHAAQTQDGPTRTRNPRRPRHDRPGHIWTEPRAVYSLGRVQLRHPRDHRTGQTIVRVQEHKDQEPHPPRSRTRPVQQSRSQVF